MKNINGIKSEMLNMVKTMLPAPMCTGCFIIFKFISCNFVQVTKNIITFAVLLGVLETCGPAEIIPYEPDMYNNSAGKRYAIHI